MTDKEYQKTILEHYKKVAHNFGLQDKCAMDDLFVRQKETDFILGEIRRYSNVNTIYDIGCGNGYLLQQLRDNFPAHQLKGIELTPELYQLATQRQIANCQLVLGDCTDKIHFDNPVDIIITERVIINILSREDQLSALKNIAHGLKTNGIYLMVESFSESLQELNQARKEMCLEPASESYQNRYLDETIINELKSMGFQEISTLMPANYLSTHFYITRIFHKSIRPSGGRVKFSRMAKFFTEALPPAVGNYSPIQFRAFQKVS